MKSVRVYQSFGNAILVLGIQTPSAFSPTSLTSARWYLLCHPLSTITTGLLVRAAIRIDFELFVAEDDMMQYGRDLFDDCLDGSCHHLVFSSQHPRNLPRTLLVVYDAGANMGIGAGSQSYNDRAVNLVLQAPAQHLLRNNLEAHASGLR